MIELIRDEYAARYPLNDNRDIDAMNAHIAPAIIATASILALAIIESSDSMIDTAISTTSIINTLNDIAYCDDLTTEPHIALRNHIDETLILDLFNMNCDDSAIRDSEFFAPIFSRNDELLPLLYPDIY